MYTAMMNSAAAAAPKQETPAPAAQPAQTASQSVSQANSQLSSSAHTPSLGSSAAPAVSHLPAQAPSTAHHHQHAPLSAHYNVQPHRETLSSSTSSYAPSSTSAVSLPSTLSLAAREPAPVSASVAPATTTTTTTSTAPSLVPYVDPALIPRSVSAGAGMIRQVLDEVQKDSREGLSSESARFEIVVPVIARQVHSTMMNVVANAGMLAGRCKRHKRLTPRDIERAFAMETGIRPIFFLSDDSSVVEGKLCGVKDVDVNLKEFLQRDLASLKRIPPAPTVKVHWLAINGVQPLIPENEIGVSDSVEEFIGREKRLRSEENLRGAPEDDSATLSREMQLYFDRVMADIVRAETSVDPIVLERSRLALANLKNDAGLNRLVPHLVRFVNAHISDNMTRLSHLWTAYNVTSAIVRNRTLDNLEFYLHELLPSLLSCILSKTVGLGPGDDHWQLRSAFGMVVAEICVRFGSKQTALLSDVVQVYSEALTGKNRPLTTMYGAVKGIVALGDEAVRNVLGRLCVRNDFALKLIAFAEEAQKLEVQGTMIAYERHFEAQALLGALKSALNGRKSIAQEFWPLLDALGHEYREFDEAYCSVFI